MSSATSTDIVNMPQCIKDSDPEVKEEYTGLQIKYKKKESEYKATRKENVELKKDKQTSYKLNLEMEKRLPYWEGDRVIYDYGKVIKKGKVTKVTIVYAIEEDDGTVSNHCNARFVKPDHGLDDY